MTSPSLAGKTLFISGASRGIGKAIALRAAQDGANIVIAAKTADPHPKLAGTIHSAAEEVEALGAKALALVVDVRDEGLVEAAVAAAVERFGGIDILINNASAIMLTGTAETPMKRYDLMHQVNTRGSFLCAQKCLPALQKSTHAHILNISPPLDLQPKWFAPHVAYSISKYGMSLNVLGMAEELRAAGIGVNALWPRTAIATAAISNIVASEQMINRCRKPEIMADAAHAVLTRDPSGCTGNFFIDDEVLAQAGVTDLSVYAMKPGAELLPDFFVEPAP